MLTTLVTQLFVLFSLPVCPEMLSIQTNKITSYHTIPPRLNHSQLVALDAGVKSEC